MARVMLAAVAAVFACAAAHPDHEAKGEGRVAPWHHAEGRAAPWRGAGGVGGGWHARMAVVGEALAASGMSLAWDAPSTEVGRGVMFGRAADGSLTAVCVAAPGAATAHDLLALVPGARVDARADAPATPAAVLVRCSDDAAYLATGRGEVAVRVPSEAGVHALLLVPAPAAVDGDKPRSVVVIATARYAVAPPAMPVPAPADAPVAVAAAEPARLRAGRRGLSDPESSPAASAAPSSLVDPANCGKEGFPPCETAEELAHDKKVEETEANFALLVAFVGCVFIVRAANKYARNPA